MFKLKPFPHYLRVVETIEGSVIGKANLFVVTLEKGYKNYTYQHELEHVKQWYTSFFTHNLRYKYRKKYRLWAEVSAYKQSIKHGRSLESCASGLMWKGYEFNLTLEQAKELLKEG